MSQLRSIVETCEPRHDVLSGGLADNHFAAQLDQVVRNPEGYPVYGDPEEFFALTFPTSGLKRLLARTFGRLSQARLEAAEHGVIRAETSFGGGKTHSLMAVYHLAKGARPANLAEFIDPVLLPAHCQVAYVEIQRAETWIELGRPERAINLFEDSLAGLPSIHRRDRGVYLARLASAYALSGSPDVSVRKGWEALTVAQATGSRRITTELGQLGSRLARWESMPEAGQLLKELQAT